MESFSFSPTLNLAEEGSCLLPKTFFETTNTVFNGFNGNNISSITTPVFGTSRGCAETINELQEVLE